MQPQEEWWHVSVQFSHSAMFNCLLLHGLQHARLPCPSPTPRACSNWHDWAWIWMKCPEALVLNMLVAYSSHLERYKIPISTLPEKTMAPHSSTLAWKIPWMEEPGELQSMGSLRVGHDWATSLSLFTFKHWRRKWQPTLVFLPGESQGQGSLVGCHLWGRPEPDTTAVT